MDCDQGRPQRSNWRGGCVITTEGVRLDARKNGQIAGSDVVRDRWNAGSTAQPTYGLPGNPAVCYRPTRSRVHLGNVGLDQSGIRNCLGNHFKQVSPISCGSRNSVLTLEKSPCDMFSEGPVNFELLLTKNLVQCCLMWKTCVCRFVGHDVVILVSTERCLDVDQHAALARARIVLDWRIIN